MNKPLVSIITPSYNQGKYIEETITSVLDQTYDNIEYIIVDGLSKDDTISILEKYKNYPNINIIIEKDSGQSDAINKGFRMAKGELVGWINSDDLLKPDCVEKVVKEYIKNRDASIFYGNIDFIDEVGNFVTTSVANDISYDFLLNVCPDITQPGSFYKSDYVREVGYLDEKLNFTMDYDLWLRLLQKGKAVKLEGSLSKFRLQQESKTMTSGNGIKFWKDIFYVRKQKHNSKFINRIHLTFAQWVFRGFVKKLTK